MGPDDNKMGDKAQDVEGKVKEGAGKMTGDDEMKTEGQKDQAMSKFKMAGEKIKDMFKK